MFFINLRHAIPPVFEKYLGFLGHRSERNKPLDFLKKKKNYDFKDGADGPTGGAAKEIQIKNRLLDSVGGVGGMI